MNDDTVRALAALEAHGILLLQDALLPSLAVLVAGEVIRGSWWGHAAGGRIFEAAGALDQHADVATFKLVDGKVCFVQRRVWPWVQAVGAAREPWQTDGLDTATGALLARVEAEGRVRATRQPAKELEQRLLCASEEVHTSSGAHATDLVSWGRFAAERGLPPEPPALEAARAELEALVRRLGEPHGKSPRLPWQPRRRR